MACGTKDAAGKVTVTLAWNPGGPDPTGQEFEVTDTGGHSVVSTTLPADTAQQPVTGLTPAANYTWYVRTVFSDGEKLESTGSFTTIGGAAGGGNMMPLILIAGAGAAALLFAMYRTKYVTQEEAKYR